MKNKDICILIKMINDSLKVKADADLKKHNLTLSQSRVLAFLNSRGGQATQKEIEDFMEVSHPTVVGIVTRMEQKGHVISHMDPKDKRNKIVQITAQSEYIGHAMKKEIIANEKKMLESLSEDDIAHLRETLEIIYNNLK